MALGDEAGAAAGIGISAATGNWIGAAVGAIGLGVSLFGSMGQADVAKKEAGVSAQIAGEEEQQNNVRQQAMMISAQRSQLQIVRNAQRARAMSIQTSTTQGASYGSGAAGGQAETTNEGYYGLQGVNNQVDFGKQMFGIDAQISQNKIQLAQLGGQSATDQGIASIGGAIMKAGPTIGAFSGNIGGAFGKMNGLFGGGSPSGYGT